MLITGLFFEGRVSTSVNSRTGHRPRRIETIEVIDKSTRPLQIDGKGLFPSFQDDKNDAKGQAEVGINHKKGEKT
jgi:hypothetical protein